MEYIVKEYRKGLHNEIINVKQIGENKRIKVDIIVAK